MRDAIACGRVGEADDVIRACNTFIQSGRDIGGRKSLTAVRLALMLTFRGMAYGRKGEDDRAIEDFKRALENDPKNPDAAGNLGLRYSAKRDFADAIAYFTAALGLSNKNAFLAEVHAFRANLYLLRGDDEHANSDYRAAIKLDPNSQKYANQKELDFALDKLP